MLAGLRTCERCDRGHLPTFHASQSEDQCSVNFVLAYRCGAVPDLHQIPLIPRLDAETSMRLAIRPAPLAVNVVLPIDRASSKVLAQVEPSG
jgi:hypothetical protein